MNLKVGMKISFKKTTWSYMNMKLKKSGSKKIYGTLVKVPLDRDGGFYSVMDEFGTRHRVRGYHLTDSVRILPNISGFVQQSFDDILFA